MGRYSNFVSELRRRNVFRTGLAYIVFAWLILQVADILLPVFDTPVQVLQITVALIAVGFPVALILAWVFEITPAGVKRTEDVALEESITHLIGRKLDFIVIGFLIAALSLSLYANFRPDSTQEQVPDPVSILIADFSNETGNELFTGVLEDTLRVGVEFARFIETYSRTDARSIAKSIGENQAETMKLDRDVASLVAIRQGIDLVISGSVSKGENGIIVDVVGVNPATQEQVFSITETATDEKEILSSIAIIAKRLRAELGDDDLTGNLGAPDSFLVTNLAAASEYVRAQDLQVSRNLEEAIQHYSKAIELDPDFVRAYVGRAMSLQYLGMVNQASKDWEVIMARLGTLTERGRLRTLGGYFITVTQDWEKALETFERLVERYPADSVGQNNLAVAAFYNLDFDRARVAGRYVVDRYPGRSGYKSNLALYAMYASDFDEALDLAQETVRQDSRNAEAWLAVALSKSMHGNRVGAKNTYLQMREIGHHGSSIAYEGLADLELYEGNHATAIEILNEGILADISRNANETAAVKYITLAEAQRHLGQSEASLAAIEHGLEIGAGYNVNVRAALLLAELGKFEKAEKIASRLSDDLSNFGRAYSNVIRATIASKMGNHVKAVEYSKTAIEVADLWLARFVLGKAYLDSDYPVEAYNEYQICKDRSGEGVAVFLDDRPSFRMIGNLNTAIDKTNELLQQTQDPIPSETDTSAN